MRILHTSDWHLGQHFFTKSREAEHSAFIRWLLTLIEEQQVDAVIIAGDLFDTGSPPSYARRLYNHLVLEMSRLQCQLVVLGGNHDSVSTLSESKALLQAVGTQVVAKVDPEPESQLITLADREGNPGALLCAIPFIRPRDVVQSEAGASSTDKQQQLGEAIRAHYDQLYQLAVARRSEFGIEMPIIATGHLTAVGATTSDSVRDIYIGTLEAIPHSVFPAADYIALGHIHRPQVIARQDHIRYSGSPIPLSFDELGRQKEVLIATFTDGKLERVTPVPVPLFQPMQVIKGSLESIGKQLSAFDEQCKESTWLAIEVDAQDYLSDLQQRVQAMTAGLNVEVLQLRRSRTERQRQLERDSGTTLAELTPQEVFARRLALETIEDSSKSERIQCYFNRIVDEVKTERQGLESSE